MAVVNEYLSFSGNCEEVFEFYRSITVKFDKAPWGALFGGFKDKFGFSWMINYDLNRPA